MKKESQKKRQDRDPTTKSIILSKTDCKKNENPNSQSTLYFEKKKFPKNRQKIFEKFSLFGLSKIVGHPGWELYLEFAENPAAGGLYQANGYQLGGVQLYGGWFIKDQKTFRIFLDSHRTSLPENLTPKNNSSEKRISSKPALKYSPTSLLIVSE